jgi:imidazolonepropionase-like amidohydrolase
MKQLDPLWLRRWMLGLLLASPLLSQAQEEVTLAPVTKTYAITNVNIIQAPGRKVDMGTVVIKDGIIKAVGKGVAIPPEAIVVKADSMYVYAGFIDGLSRVGVIKPKEENKERVKDPGNPPPDRAGITPQTDVRTFLNATDKSVEELRAVGFTTAHVVPYGGMLPGSGAIVLLGGNSVDNMVLANNTSMYSELASAERVYPGTTIGVMAKWRELYKQAVLSKNYEVMYAANRNGLERPTPDRVSQAFYSVIDKRTPVFFKSEKVLDVQRVLSLQNDLGFSLVLVDVKEGWDVINKVKAANAKVFLSLDLPELKKEETAASTAPKKDEAKKETDSKPEVKKEDKPKTMADIEKEALEKRKADFTAKYAAQASVFQKAGFTFGFSTLSAKTKDIPTNLRRMVAAGLSEDQALAALTTSPAQLLGLADRMGTIDNGKMANLVITDKSFFNEKAKVRYVFVDGVMYKQEIKDEKKADPNAKKADVAGQWSYTAETPQGANTGIIKIKKEGDAYSGSITSSMSDKENNLQDIVIDGNKLSFNYTVEFGGNSLKVEIDVSIDSNTFEGTMTAGRFGSFPIKGSKEPNK